MSAGQESDSPIRENRTLLPAPLPPDEARGTLAAAAGVSTVGLPPPFDTPAAAFSSRLSRRSHLDCRAATADVPRSQKSLLAKSHLIRTPIAMQLKWLLGAVHRRKHPELWELYLEEKRLPLPLARLLKSDS